MNEIPAKAQTEINRNKYQQLRVAAYCKVSTEQEEQQISYQVQIAYQQKKGEVVGWNFRRQRDQRYKS